MKMNYNLRQLIFIVLSLCVVFTLTCCDKNKSKIEKISKKFIAAVNDGDRAEVYAIYPSSKNFENLKMVRTLEDGDITVELDDSTCLYIATIHNPREQKLVFKVDSVQQFLLVDSYGILQLDSLSSELALNTGVPLKKISDIEQSLLMNDNSLFITYLKEENYSAVNGTLTTMPSTYSWGVHNNSAYLTLNINIQNYGDKLIKGSDYYLEVDVQRKSAPLGYQNIKTCDGVDISPGERRVFEINDPGMYKYAVGRDLTWNCNIKYRRNDVVSALLEYGKFSGNEYEKFVGIREGMEVRINSTAALAINKKVGHVDCFEEPTKNSKVKDTAYNRQLISVVGDENHEGWSKAYLIEDYNKYKFLGYISNDDWVYQNESSEEMPLYITEYKTTSSDKSDIPIYKNYNTKGDVVKSIKSGTKIFGAYEGDDAAKGMMSVFEADGKGGYNLLGYIKEDNIVFEGYD